ncbi:MAG TPA: exopolysaccharide biosynthesis polyprenyl glycosylphosphotransferase [Polyangiaceae bacterium]|nr:exopolysaccharide biosynthesis polyprenyl glycosylphosphotransferase [Polyangiaceae bacterium]
MQSSDAPRRPKDAPAPAFYRRRRRRDNELGQVLLRNGVIRPEQLRRALRVQAETGGHVGAILRRMGACDSRAIAEALIEQMHTARARGKGRSIARRARENPSIGWLEVHCRPWRVTASLFVIDVLTLGLGASLVWMLGHTGHSTVLQRFGVGALAVICLSAFAALRFYAVTPPSPPDEIRNAAVIITLGYAGCWVVAVLGGQNTLVGVPHGGFLLGWLTSLLLVPTARGFWRSVMAKRPWWGVPVVVMGAGKVGRAVVGVLQARPQLGLKPVAILDDDPLRQGTVRATWGDNDIVIEPVHPLSEVDVAPSSERSSALEQFSEVDGVPVVGGLELGPALAQRLKVSTAVLAMPEMDAATMLGTIERFADHYTNVLIIPDLFNLTHFGAPTRYLGGALGIEVQRQLLLRGPRIVKRAMDIIITGIGLILALPLLVPLAIMIRLDSPGSAFHKQKRLGQDGVRFEALKFRTMFLDAEARLSEVLASDPALRAEYEESHKLVRDPRVTRVGRFLRKFSLDEIPQLWNVLMGDMSLVGPRPYLEREIPDMAQKESVILRVKPGITGIWQVTVRNESTFEQRLQLDVEYVRNWSPWLDLYILARTVPVVFGGTGT